MPAAKPLKHTLKDAWLAGEPELLPFCGPNPYQPDWAAVAEARANTPVDRELLVRVLKRQYAGFSGTEAVLLQVEALREPNTFCITTGQQPGFMGGPLYTLYKAITAIQLARQLTERYPAFRFVPLFWVASEDHDVDEVNHAYVGYRNKHTYEGLSGGAVGRDVLTDAVVPLVAHSPLLQAAYTPGRTWGEAFRHVLHGLLGQEGLVVLEPDDAELKQAFAPVVSRELAHPGASEAAVISATEALEALGYAGQIHPRPVNLFLLRPGARLRLARTAGGQLQTVDGSPADEDALQAALAQNRWEDFSPNVVLRPVYQETVVPSVAYVGGWAEVSYWLQLRRVFALHESFLPLVLPRAQALVLRESETHALAALDLTLDQLLQPDVRLKHLLAVRQWDGTVLAPAKLQVAQALAELESTVGAIDTGQLRNLKGAQVQTERFFAHLEAKLRRQLVQQHPAWIAPAFDLKHAIQPQGAVQERVLNWSAFAAAAPMPFVQFLLSGLDATARGIQPLVWPGS